MRPSKAAIFTDRFSTATFRNIGTALARGFQEAGWRCDLVVIDARAEDTARYPDVHVVSLGARRAILSLVPLVRYLRRERPDVLFAMPWYFNVLAIWAKHLARVPTKVIMIEQNVISLEARVEHRYNARMRLVPWLMRWSYPFGDGLIGVAEDVTADLRDKVGISRKIPMRAVPNTIDVAYTRRRAEEPLEPPAWMPPPGTPLVVTVARLAHQKRVDVLLRAFARVLGRVPAAKLVILGEGVLRAELEALCRELGIAGSVVMPGFAANPCWFMARCDVFVLASAWEGCPVAVEEAMACGAAVVVNDALGGSKDLVGHGKHGLMVPALDENALAEAICRLLTDAGLREDFRRRAAARAQDFDYSQVSREYLDFYRQVATR